MFDGRIVSKRSSWFVYTCFCDTAGKPMSVSLYISRFLWSLTGPDAFIVPKLIACYGRQYNKIAD
jgi:hypothetical protein